MRFSIQTMIWAIVLIALLMAGGLAFMPASVDVETAKIVEGPLRVSVREDGKTRVREKYIVSAPVAGRLSRIELDSGDQIVCDETLIAVILPGDPAMLDARARAEAEARVESAVAAVHRSESAVEQARINQELADAKFQRSKKLLANQSTSQDEFDVARAEYFASNQAIKAAEFDAEIAKFELKMARAAANQFNAANQSNQGKTESSDGGPVEDQNDAIGGDVEVEPFEIVAPVSGKVLRVFQESSVVVNVGTPLLELGDPSHLEIEVDVLSTDAVRIKPGAELTVEHWGGQDPLQAKVRVIEPAAFTKVSSLGVEEQRVNVIADFDEKPDRLARLGDGYRIEARITVDELANVLLVPNSALFRHQRQWHVFAIADGRAVMRQVKIGLQNESHTELIDGLRQDDEVIVYPNDKIADETKVRKVN
ncbi:MAG: HlyD family efflux transporter periplasmic adaptor subunit [Pirellulaceae bacterium]|nr:HlyD family efflux transporter periplasmic adaptor subunit [Pirellulaceae bacterium]